MEKSNDTIVRQKKFIRIEYLTEDLKNLELINK